MYVQDLTSPGTNITAEISKDEANNFIQMCNMFASTKLHEQSIDDYMMKLSQIRTARSTEPIFDLHGVPSTMNGVNELNKACMNTLQNLKMAASRGSSSLTNNRSRASSICTTHSTTSTQKLLNVIDVKKVYHAIPAIAVDLVYRRVQRCFEELEIQALLTRYLNEFDSNLRVMPFGSATYGFGGSRTNFNILVDAGSSNLIEIDLIHMTVQNILCPFQVVQCRNHLKSFNHSKCYSERKVYKVISKCCPVLWVIVHRKDDCKQFIAHLVFYARYN